jgi:hypothetical protein
MLIPARKLAIAVIACALGLFLIAPAASADEVGALFEAAGLASTTPLTDQSMSQLRGGGFETALSGLLFGLLEQSDGASVAGATPSGAHGVLESFFPAFLDELPAINLVAAELNDQPTVMRIGTVPQSLGCGNGLSCPVGMSVSLYADNNASAGSLLLNLNVTH